MILPFQLFFSFLTLLELFDSIYQKQFSQEFQLFILFKKRFFFFNFAFMTL
jgi:hypothetical protein